MLDKIHDVGSIVHVILIVPVSTPGQTFYGHQSINTNSLQLLQNTGMEVFIQVPIFQGIMSSLLRRRNRGTQMLQLRRESHAHLKRIRHHLAGR